MSKPFTAKSMMRDSSFSDYFKTCEATKLHDIETRIERLILSPHAQGDSQADDERQRHLLPWRWLLRF